MNRWVGVGRSDIGLVRSSNQDAYVLMDHFGLWAVADGMGGHTGGDIAAQTAIDSIKTRIEASVESLQQDSLQDPVAFLSDLLHHAHTAILERVHHEPSLKGMGTTIVVLLIPPHPTPVAYVAHLGDSRAYLFRAGELVALTRDHTLIEKYLERGILSPQMARTHPDRHVLTQALGVSSSIRPSISSYPLHPDDLLLLCSDGLTKMLDDNRIREICSKSQGDPFSICDSLIAASLDGGGLDNVTVVVVGHV
ncbi:MAG: protein phosphatase 2C domain-containing protein [Nitrospira sp.]|nr:protein phosphatase 2C domain-containing protein [Nitrospira sp.]